MPGLALITGASGGLGAAFAKQLAAKGYDLVLVARRLDRLEALAKDLDWQHGVRVETLAADLTTPEGLSAAERRIYAAPDLEILVNNAGFGTLGKFSQSDVEVQEEMHRLHVIAPLRLTRAALEGMVERGRGGVILVSSVAAFLAAPGSVSYCATKRWMNAFAEGLSLELAGSPVTVQALCPGYTHTEFHDRMAFDRGRIPGFLWLDADFVVAKSLEAFDRGRSIVVPGWQYKLVVLLTKLLPAALLRAVSKRQQRLLGRD
ncbi:MAG: SDR family NAD(P)-dependent oxidoreductase [Bryobacteraceae bacterium]